MTEMSPEPDTRTAMDAPVQFDTKVIVALREDLLPWQELNVTAFLMSGIVTSAADLTENPIETAMEMPSSNAPPAGDGAGR